MHISGESIEYIGYGEGQDRADKALYKAITGGKKYLIANIFNVPTTDDPETDSHEGFDTPAVKTPPPPAKAAPAPQVPAPQAANKPRQATQAQPPTKTPPAAKAPVGGQKNGQAAQNKKAFVINEKEQQTRGCINSTLVAELRQAVLAQQKCERLDPVAEFMPWVDAYLDALMATPGMEAYKRMHKGTAQLLLDIPATAYAEILERVQKEPESCKPGYAEATEQAQAQDDSGVV
jgi:hypothetical protein